MYVFIVGVAAFILFLMCYGCQQVINNNYNNTINEQQQHSAHLRHLQQQQHLQHQQHQHQLQQQRIVYSIPITSPAYSNNSTVDIDSPPPYESVVKFSNTQRRII